MRTFSRSECSTSPCSPSKLLRISHGCTARKIRTQEGKLNIPTPSGKSPPPGKVLRPRRNARKPLPATTLQLRTDPVGGHPPLRRILQGSPDLRAPFPRLPHWRNTIHAP